MSITSNAQVLRELARVKALFQARTIAAVIGAPAPVVAKLSDNGVRS